MRTTSFGRLLYIKASIAIGFVLMSIAGRLAVPRVSNFISQHFLPTMSYDPSPRSCVAVHLTGALNPTSSLLDIFLHALLRMV